MTSPACDLPKALAAQFRAARQARGWSQTELSEKSGVSRVMVTAIETGARGMTWAVAGKLAAALGGSVQVILTLGPCPACKGKPRKRSMCLDCGRSTQ